MPIKWGEYPNFSKWEFDCSHTDKNRMRPELLKVLQQARTIYGKPVVVTSGYRDKTHPVEAKKARPGEHSHGLAADISIPRQDVIEFVAILHSLGVKRIGLKITTRSLFIHVGVGDRGFGFPAIPWTY